MRTSYRIVTALLFGAGLSFAQISSVSAQAGGHASVGLGHGEEGYLHLEEMIKHIEYSLQMPDAKEGLKIHGAEALKHAEVYRSLVYHVFEEGVLKEVELDGLLMLDSALFLVEAKAGSLSPPARRGARKRMVGDIKELVEQAKTVLTTISDVPAVELTRREAKVQLLKGGLYTYQGPIESAVECIQQSLGLSEKLNDLQEITHSLIYLGKAYLFSCESSHQKGEFD